MKVLILGASGIIGQHMRLSIPTEVKATFHRRYADANHIGCELGSVEVRDMLDSVRPDVIVNLAGESRPDVVEEDPELHEWINFALPCALVLYPAYLVQVSTQAVFSGEEPPYGAYSAQRPVNAYGRQKTLVELILANTKHVSIVRPTFVLGVRPMQDTGRKNPIEQMLEGQRNQVYDRWFSPSFAPDVADCLWETVLRQPGGILNAGVPTRTSRWEIARELELDPEPVRHEDFPGLAPRPKDTTYAEGSCHAMTFEEGLQDCLNRYEHRQCVQV